VIGWTRPGRAVAQHAGVQVIEADALRVDFAQLPDAEALRRR
jgi:hypothetical protein